MGHLFCRRPVERSQELRGDATISGANLNDTLKLLASVSSEARFLRATLASLTDSISQQVSEIREGTRNGVIELRKVCDVTALAPLIRDGLLESIFIEYPRIAKILNDVGRCHLDGITTRSVDREPQCMLIAGGTNAGKTELHKFYQQAFTREITEHGTIVPILPVVLPYPAKPKDVAMELLKKLGDPNAARGSTAQLGSRVADYIRKCKVQLIILDEFHHFIDRYTHKVLLDASEWLKRLIKETLVPVIALGKPISTEVLDYDEQIRRLFCRRAKLVPFDWDYLEEPSNKDFRRFLLSVDMQLPLGERSDLSSEAMALRIHYASDGVVGYVMTMVREAFDLARADGQEKIEMRHLSRAFTDRIQSSKPKKQNPFLPSTFTTALAAHWLKEEQPVPEDERQKEIERRTRSQRASDALRAK